MPLDLAHTIHARHHGDMLLDRRFGNLEDRGILVVELDGEVACHLHMLLLVAPHRHNIGLHGQDVRRHEYRIGDQAV